MIFHVFSYAIIGERNNKDLPEIIKEFLCIIHLDFKVIKAADDKKHGIAITILSNNYVDHTKPKSENFLMDIMELSSISIVFGVRPVHS